MNWLKKLRDKVKTAVNNVVHEVKKDIQKVADEAKKDIKKARELAKKIANKIANTIVNVALLPIVPMIPSMKHLLKLRGQDTGGSIKDIVERFYNTVVRNSAHFEDLEALDMDSFSDVVYAHLEAGINNNFAHFELGSNGHYEHIDEDPKTSKEFDLAGTASKAGGAAAGMALGLPPQAGAAIGEGIEKIIKTIVSFFKKHKDDPEVKAAVDKAGDTTGGGGAGKQQQNNETVDEHLTPEAIIGGGHMDMKKIAMWVGGALILIFALKYFEVI